MNQTNERWLPIPGFPSYLASSLGRIKNAKFGNVLKPSPQAGTGYLRVNLWEGRKPKAMRVHRLVCMAFYGPSDGVRRVVAHNDGNILNNTASNLRWATQSENLMDIPQDLRKRKWTEGGLKIRKLSDDDVATIRKCQKYRGMIIDLAKMFGVSRQYIYLIRTKPDRIRPV